MFACQRSGVFKKSLLLLRSKWICSAAGIYPDYCECQLPLALLAFHNQSLLCTYSDWRGPYDDWLSVSSIFLTCHSKGENCKSVGVITGDKINQIAGNSQSCPRKIKESVWWKHVLKPTYQEVRTSHFSSFRRWTQSSNFHPTPCATFQGQAMQSEAQVIFSSCCCLPTSHQQPLCGGKAAFIHIITPWSHWKYEHLFMLHPVAAYLQVIF